MRDRQRASTGTENSEKGEAIMADDEKEKEEGQEEEEEKEKKRP